MEIYNIIKHAPVVNQTSLRNVMNSFDDMSTFPTTPALDTHTQKHWRKINTEKYLNALTF